MLTKPLNTAINVMRLNFSHGDYMNKAIRLEIDVK